MKTKSKIYLASILRKTLGLFPGFRSVDQPISVRRSGLLWELDLDEGVDFAIFIFGCFEVKTQKVLKSLINPGDTVLDIGANIGSHSLMFSTYTGDSGKVYSFEPTEFAYKKILKNIKINSNKVKNITVYQMMLGSGKEEIPKEIPSSWPLGSVEGTDSVFGGVLKSTRGATLSTLDSVYLNDLIPSPPDFVKIDVDGYERDVLCGGIETLKKYKPKIMIEYMPSGLEEAGWGAREFLGFFKNLSYGVWSPDVKTLVTESYLNSIKLGSGVNLFCLPLDG